MGAMNCYTYRRASMFLAGTGVAVIGMMIFVVSHASGVAPCEMKSTTRWVRVEVASTLKNGALLSGVILVSMPLATLEEKPRTVRVISHDLRITKNNKIQCSFSGTPLVESAGRSWTPIGAFTLAPPPGKGKPDDPEPFDYRLMIEPRTNLTWGQVEKTEDVLVEVRITEP